MKKNLFSVFVCACLTGCAIFPDSNYRLTVVHTGDTHSAVENYPKILSIAREQKAKKQNFLFVDSGDFSSGTLFYTLYKNDGLIPLINAVQYDVTGVGNHEFDKGETAFQKFVGSVQNPVVSANIKTTYKTALKPHIVFEKGGRKIGVFGLLTPAVKTIAADLKNTTLTDPVTAARKQVDDLKKQGADIIILLSHLGLDDDKALAHKVPDIDVIVSGHTHALLSNTFDTKKKVGKYPLEIKSADGRKTLIVAAGSGGRFVGVLDIAFDKDGNVASYAGDTVETRNAAPVEPLKGMVSAVQKQMAKVAAIPLSAIDTDVARTKDDKCRADCFLGEFITDVTATGFQEAEIVLINAGSIRSEIKKGTITYETAANIFPFSDTFVMIELTGAEIKEMLRTGILSKGRGNGFLQAAKLSYSFKGDTLTKATVNGKPIKDDRLYTVLTTSFITDGGDGFPKRANARTVAPDILQKLTELLRSKPLWSPVLQHRITQE